MRPDPVRAGYGIRATSAFCQCKLLAQMVDVLEQSAYSAPYLLCERLPLGEFVAVRP
ncbi:hypothetical protein GR223_32560 [Rhizobium leguminosarum]|uniref:hypothetical protein n=1 Tax=Rhizobium ruizarguesonis TaxID=2081791 RepID=UPI0013D3687F|nr:hypothetical protein [Rhizobium ruizarguesonis]NEH80585.1 hypothetical protein [Rhizobium ruizarguesonis]NEI75529.1 hypothetical protein [Rhizobium ruizarguesonis]NEJ90619.1 hypothetical protein [Rhizobium ruizarguesonis]